MKRLIIQLSMTVFVAAIAAIALGLFIPKTADAAVPTYLTTARFNSAWNEITPEQQREFRQEYIRFINNGIYSHQPEMAMADSPFYDNVALGNCARENTEQSM